MAMVGDLVECEPPVREGRRVRGVMRWRSHHARAVVWAALTHSDKLAQWLAPGVIEARPGGAVALAFEHSGVVIDSRVVAVEPERLLQYSWSGPGQPERPICWTLSEEGDELLVTLSVLLPEDEEPARGLAGWAAHLEMLAISLEGVAPRFPYEHFKAHRVSFGKQLLTGPNVGADA
jgi:uncharacterized protein YndB with AHSA1/START domain